MAKRKKKAAKPKGRTNFYRVKAINFGWYRRKHNILLENLPPAKQKLLLENRYFRWMAGDAQLFELIFRVEDMQDLAKTRDQPVWNPYRDEFTGLRQFLEDSKWIDWQCAICAIPIKADTTDFSVANFVCGECGEVHHKGNKTIDQRIVEASKRFTQHYRETLQGDQADHKRYAKRQAKL